MRKKKTNIQKMIAKQAREQKKVKLSKGAQEMAEWIYGWESHIKTGKFKKRKKL